MSDHPNTGPHSRAVIDAGEAVVRPQLFPKFFERYKDFDLREALIAYWTFVEERRLDYAATHDPKEPSAAFLYQVWTRHAGLPWAMGDFEKEDPIPTGIWVKVYAAMREAAANGLRP